MKKEDPYFSLVEQAIAYAFIYKGFETKGGKRGLPIYMEIAFLESDMVQAFCDCSDNFEQDKLIQEFKKRDNFKKTI